MILASTRSFTGADGALLVAVSILIVGSAVLSLVETGLTRTSRARAKSLDDAGQRGARSLRRLVEEPESFLAPILLLVLLCQLVAATLVGVIAAQVFGPLGVAIATAFEVIVIFVFSEAVPKQWAVRHTDRAALLGGSARHSAREISADASRLRRAHRSRAPHHSGRSLWFAGG